MKTFKIIYSLSKNKANVGDKFKMDSGNREVVKITNRYVYLDNNNYFPVKMFSTWMRIALDIQKRDEQSLIKKMKIDHQEKEIRIMRKEVKAEYDKKWRTPGKHQLGRDTQLLPYIVLTGVGDTVKFYFSPTTKTDLEDLELSYKSLHGVNYKAFAYGNYIRHNNHYALIGMYPYNNSNLSEKRKKFAMYCINKEYVDTNDGQNRIKLQVKLYSSMLDLFNVKELLSSDSASIKSEPKEEKRHWSGLSGDIATSMLDQAIDNMYQDDDDFPF